MDQKRLKEQKAILTSAHHDYERGLNKRAFFKVSNRITGEDLVQETFLKTWRYIIKGGKIEVMRAFLYHVLNDLIIDEYRKRKIISLDALSEKGFQASVDYSEHIFNTLDGKTALLLIQRLPEKYKKVMYM